MSRVACDTEECRRSRPGAVLHDFSHERLLGRRVDSEDRLPSRKSVTCTAMDERKAQARLSLPSRSHATVSGRQDYMQYLSMMRSHK